MASRPRLKDKYTMAKCCQPAPGSAIVGYYSFDDILKVHHADCTNLEKADPERLVQLQWPEILAPQEFVPDEDYAALENADFAILKHHLKYDIDYSLKVAAVLRIDKQEAFERHKKLTDSGLLERVPAVMVRYRKNTAANKWIKHRNHTYYRLTDKGQAYLKHRDSLET
jgi:hypothetical protein